jgi:hypothetical protein
MSADVFSPLSEGAAQAFYNRAAKTNIKTAMVLAYQTSGEFVQAGRPRLDPNSV